MRKAWQISAVIALTTLALIIAALHPAINVNNRFVFYVLIVCTAVAMLIAMLMRKQILVRNLLLAVIGMSAFAFILVPLNNVFCDVTGLNGKLDLTINEATTKGIDLSCKITVEFVVSRNQMMPWEFRPKHHGLTMYPGQLVTTAYFAKNTTHSTMYAQAIPSISPSKASKYFKKVECFCFNKQKLGPGEAAHLGLRFYLDPDIPKDVQRVTLAYTIFDITQQEQ